MYSDFCSSCSYEPEIIKIGQSSHKMYSNNIVNFQESTTILNTSTKNIWKLLKASCIYTHTHIYIIYYIYIYIYTHAHTHPYIYWVIGLMNRVFANGSSYTKDSKMVLDATLFSTQHYKIWINGKVEKSREWCSTLPYTSVL